VWIRHRAVGLYALVAIAAIGIGTAFAPRYRPVLVHSPGDWNCACSEMYIKTTMRAISNPFRDSQPEAVSDAFLSKLRANECVVGPELCQDSLPSRRVSGWKLSYPEDDGDTATLYYKLT
jgi:hypothetical protein